MKVKHTISSVDYIKMREKKSFISILNIYINLKIWTNATIMCDILLTWYAVRPHNNFYYYYESGQDALYK